MGSGDIPNRLGDSAPQHPNGSRLGRLTDSGTAGPRNLSEPAVDSAFDAVAGAMISAERSAMAARSREATSQIASRLGLDHDLAGVLVDLAERRVPVHLSTQSGAQHRGEISGVGTDMAYYLDDRHRMRVVRLAAIGSITAAPGHVASADQREVRTEQGFDELLVDLWERRAEVSVGIIGGAGSAPVTGRLLVCGSDVVGIQASERNAPVTYIPIASIAELTVVDLD